MKRILIYGLAPVVGGVEVIVTEVVRRTSDRIKYTILLSGDNHNQLYDGLGDNVEIMQITAWGKSRRKFRSELTDILSEGHYDYIWINGCIMANREVVAIPRQLGVKIILHSHGSSFEESNPLKRMLLLSMHKLNHRLYLQTADIAFMCSQRSGAWYYGEKFAKAGKVKLFKNGIETEKYRFRSSTREKYRKVLGVEDKTVIINVGRLSPVKNQHKLIDITAECIKEGLNVHLIIAGDGELRNEHAKSAEELGIADKVSLLGERNDVSELYQAADIFMLPSLHEGFPVSLLEAQTCGLQCIVSTGVSPETNISGQVVYLPVEASDKLWVESVARAMSETIDRNYAYKKIIEAGYDINSVCQGFINALERHDK